MKFYTSKIALGEVGPWTSPFGDAVAMATHARGPKTRLAPKMDQSQVSKAVTSFLGFERCNFESLQICLLTRADVFCSTRDIEVMEDGKPPPWPDNVPEQHPGDAQHPGREDLPQPSGGSYQQDVDDGLSVASSSASHVLAQIDDALREETASSTSYVSNSDTSDDGTIVDDEDTPSREELDKLADTLYRDIDVSVPAGTTHPHASIVPSSTMVGAGLVTAPLLSVFSVATTEGADTVSSQTGTTVPVTVETEQSAGEGQTNFSALSPVLPVFGHQSPHPSMVSSGPGPDASHVAGVPLESKTTPDASSKGAGVQRGAMKELRVNLGIRVDEKTPKKPEDAKVKQSDALALVGQTTQQQAVQSSHFAEEESRATAREQPTVVQDPASLLNADRKALQAKFQSMFERFSEQDWIEQINRVVENFPPDFMSLATPEHFINLDASERVTQVTLSSLSDDARSDYYSMIGMSKASFGNDKTLEPFQWNTEMPDVPLPDTVEDLVDFAKVYPEMGHEWKAEEFYSEVTFDPSLEDELLKLFLGEWGQNPASFDSPEDEGFKLGEDWVPDEGLWPKQLDTTDAAKRWWCPLESARRDITGITFCPPPMKATAEHPWWYKMYYKAAMEMPCVASWLPLLPAMGMATPSRVSIGSKWILYSFWDDSLLLCWHNMPVAVKVIQQRRTFWLLHPGSKKYPSKLSNDKVVTCRIEDPSQLHPYLTHISVVFVKDRVDLRKILKPVGAPETLVSLHEFLRVNQEAAVYGYYSRYAICNYSGNVMSDEDMSHVTEGRWDVILRASGCEHLVDDDYMQRQEPWCEEEVAPRRDENNNKNAKPDDGEEEMETDQHQVPVVPAPHPPPPPPLPVPNPTQPAAQASQPTAQGGAKVDWDEKTPATPVSDIAAFQGFAASADQFHGEGGGATAAPPAKVQQPPEGPAPTEPVQGGASRGGPSKGQPSKGEGAPEDEPPTGDTTEAESQEGEGSAEETTETEAMDADDGDDPQDKDYVPTADTGDQSDSENHVSEEEPTQPAALVYVHPRTGRETRTARTVKRLLDPDHGDAAEIVRLVRELADTLERIKPSRGMVHFYGQGQTVNRGVTTCLTWKPGQPCPLRAKVGCKYPVDAIESVGEFRAHWLAFHVAFQKSLCFCTADMSPNAKFYTHGRGRCDFWCNSPSSILSHLSKEDHGNPLGTTLHTFFEKGVQADNWKQSRDARATEARANECASFVREVRQRWEDDRKDCWEPLSLDWQIHPDFVTLADVSASRTKRGTSKKWWVWIQDGNSFNRDPREASGNLMVCPRPNTAPFEEMKKKDIAFFLHFPKSGSAKTKENNQELDHMRWLARVTKSREGYLSRHGDEYRTFVLQQYFGKAQTSVPWVKTGGQVSVCDTEFHVPQAGERLQLRHGLFPLRGLDICPNSDWREELSRLNTVKKRDWFNLMVRGVQFVDDEDSGFWVRGEKRKQPPKPPKARAKAAISDEEQLVVRGQKLTSLYGQYYDQQCHHRFSWGMHRIMNGVGTLDDLMVGAIYESCFPEMYYFLRNKYFLNPSHPEPPLKETDFLSYLDYEASILAQAEGRQPVRTEPGVDVSKAFMVVEQTAAAANMPPPEGKPPRGRSGKKHKKQDKKRPRSETPSGRESSSSRQSSPKRKKDNGKPKPKPKPKPPHKEEKPKPKPKPRDASPKDPKPSLAQQSDLSRLEGLYAGVLSDGSGLWDPGYQAPKPLPKGYVIPKKSTDPQATPSASGSGGATGGEEPPKDAVEFERWVQSNPNTEAGRAYFKSKAGAYGITKVPKGLDFVSLMHSRTLEEQASDGRIREERRRRRMMEVESPYKRVPKASDSSQIKKSDGTPKPRPTPSGSTPSLITAEEAEERRRSDGMQEDFNNPLLPPDSSDAGQYPQLHSHLGQLKDEGSRVATTSLRRRFSAVGEDPTAPNRLVGRETMSGMAAETGIGPGTGMGPNMVILNHFNKSCDALTTIQDEVMTQARMGIVALAEHNKYLVDKVDVLLKENERLNQNLQAEHTRNTLLCDRVSDLEADLATAQGAQTVIACDSRHLDLQNPCVPSTADGHRTVEGVKYITVPQDMRPQKIPFCFKGGEWGFVDPADFRQLTRVSQECARSWDDASSTDRTYPHASASEWANRAGSGR